MRNYRFQNFAKLFAWDRGFKSVEWIDDLSEGNFRGKLFKDEQVGVREVPWNRSLRNFYPITGRIWGRSSPIWAALSQPPGLAWSFR